MAVSENGWQEAETGLEAVTVTGAILFQSGSATILTANTLYV